MASFALKTAGRVRNRAAALERFAAGKIGQNIHAQASQNKKNKSRTILGGFPSIPPFGQLFSRLRRS
jgi:hypothetical protein